MDQGGKDLELELARGRANNVEEMNGIAAPVGTKHFPGRGAMAGFALVAALAAVTAAAAPSRGPRRAENTRQAPTAPLADATGPETGQPA